MKLQALIAPRKDNTVKLVGQDGVEYVFRADENGDLVCDVDHIETVTKALAGGLFAPADADDFEVAEQLITKAVAQAKAEDEGDDEDDEQVDMGAAPIEAATPPKRFKNPKKVK